MPHTNSLTYVYLIPHYHAYVSYLKELIMHQKLINYTNCDKELLVFKNPIVWPTSTFRKKKKKTTFFIAKATLSQQISNNEPTYVTNVKQMYKGLLTEAKEFCISCRALAIWLARVPRAELPWDTEETIRKKKPCWEMCIHQNYECLGSYVYCTTASLNFKII